MLEEYLKLAHRLGIAATSRYAIGTEVVAEAEKLCLEVASEYRITTCLRIPAIPDTDSS